MPVTARLSKAFYDQFGEQVTNELMEWFNLVDLTYRNELRTLNDLNFARFEALLDSRFARADLQLERHLNERFGAFEQRFLQFEQRNDALRGEFEQRIDRRLRDFEQRTDTRLTDLEQRTDTRLTDFEQRTDARLADFEQRTDTRLTDFEQRTDARLADFEQRTDTRLTDLEQRIGTRLTDAEQRMDARLVDGEQRLDTRIAGIEQRLVGIERQLPLIRDELRTAMAQQLRWMIGLWIATTAALLALLAR